MSSGTLGVPDYVTVRVVVFSCTTGGLTGHFCRSVGKTRVLARGLTGW